MIGALDRVEELHVLVIGADADVLAFVTKEVAAAGLNVEGVTIDRVCDLGPRRFDLVAFGAGIGPEVRRAVRASLRRHNPDVRFIRTYAPYAASQIVEAVRAPLRPPAVDLDAYCKRIGYDGPRDATLETLLALQERHLSEIPFEAIDVLRGVEVDISPRAVDAKLIGSRRGGYCYEQNGLFRRVLRAIGFEVESLVAAVRWMMEPGAVPPPRTHMVLRVMIDETPWLVDVGFGSSVPPVPLRLDTRGPQPTAHGRYRIIPLGAGQLVQAEGADGWLPLYDFSAEPLLDEHYELFNWFTSTHDQSHFRHQLIVAKTTPEARYALLDGRFSIRSAGGGLKREYLDVAGIEGVLETTFGLTPDAAWKPVLRSAADRTAREAHSSIDTNVTLPS